MNTPYEKQIAELTELKEIIQDRLELLFMVHGTYKPLLEVEPVVNYVEDGMIINNFALIRYSETFVAPIITFKDIETEVETALCNIIINNVDEVKDWVKKYQMLKITLENFDNKTVSDLSPEHTKLMEDLEMSITADLIENKAIGSVYQINNTHTLKIITYGYKFTDIEIYQGEDLLVSENLSKEDLFSRLSFIITEL